MGYKALYRTWRPRTFNDVVGQSHITQTLQNAIESGKFSHAYLFSGPRGTGKTSAAKIFAQTINCETMPAREPCNECKACKGILDGSIPDVIEIDAASNTSVDDIRDIRERVKYAPSVVPYKVYIIDEVHMISVNAFNALLKTLEEPPAHVVFILATTEPHKIPLTIISRCQRFDFRSISHQAMMERMNFIVEQEKIDITEEALESIALVAEGGMRDALSILDQVISYSEQTADVEDVLAVTGGVSQDILTDLTIAMYEQDSERVIELFDELMQHGKDAGRFVFDMIYFMRDLLFYKTNRNLKAYLERAIITEQFEALANEVEAEWIEQAIVHLTECEQQLKWTTSPKVFVEVTLITITNRHTEANNNQNVANMQELVQLQQRIEQLEKRLTQLQQRPIQEKPQKQQNTARSSPRRQNYEVPYERIRGVLDQAKKAPLQQVKTHWPTFLEQLRQVSLAAHATLHDSKPVAASDDAIILSFKYNIHCSLFLEHRQVIESVLANSLAHYTIIPIPEQDWQTLREQYVQAQQKGKKKDVKETTKRKDPLVDEAKRLFGEEIVEVKEE
ncbi:MAG TPA: DNA polymerase III subunit gamma/tau [Pseudogracilibacillus sp.]|nr:DNA polymerase III subunit gamma/tau [Pseudogracilibacillus sp.]